MTAALDGRRALVTGASGGIGRAVVAALAGAGAELLGVSRTHATLEALEAELPIRTLASSVADAEGCADVAAWAARSGGVDVLVHCAGVDTHRERAIWEQPDDVWDETMAANAFGAYELTRLLAGPMVQRAWGRIVFVASTAGQAGGAASSAYCAAKHAMVGVMRAAAVDLAPHGVTANAVAPGWVAPTAMSDRSFARMAESEGIAVDEVVRRLEAEQPAGRLVRPDEVAAAVLFLAGPGAGAVNGEVLRVAGGSLW
jgi:3-hydroxybutyrate dehydrogenase